MVMRFPDLSENNNNCATARNRSEGRKTPLNPIEIEKKLDRFLLTVEKPGRYVGGEFNAVHKNADDVRTRVALAFPDIYDLGVPNLGLAIFYDQLNRDPNIWAERVYAPWIDMEEHMRANDIPLYTLESKTPLAQMDVIGFTLPYESLCTNVLNMLDLAKLPLKSIDRDADDPLIIAGGHATFNPEPMAPFIDAFAIGEGEDLFDEIIAVYSVWRNSGADRRTLLETLATLPGVYVPSFYTPFYNEDGTLKAITPLSAQFPSRIRKRIVPILPPPPEHFVVPSIDVIQNRVAVEIMRGCSRGCRFCHAGFVTRPVRERPVDEIMNAIDNALDETGYEEIALLSLSSSDYTQIQPLVERIKDAYAKRKLNISLPSLRIESLSVDLFEKLRGGRAGGFTLAPEAASDNVRASINKPISEEQLLDTVQVIFNRGYQTIKLYFMIGLPGETIEDVKAIAETCIKVIKIGRRIHNKRSQLNVGVSTFVPKPHTPFQWCAVADEDDIHAKQALLRDMLRTPGVKVSWSDANATFFESWMSRGDRRMANVILSAWQNGAKFDAWQDQFRKDVWLNAFEENGIDPAFFAARERGESEVFPWDHIDTGVTKRTLRREFERSQRRELRNDCREGCYGCGVNRAFSAVQPGKDSERRWFCPVIEADPQSPATPSVAA